jgi:hypothetical protein
MASARRPSVFRVLRLYRPGHAAHLVKDWLPALTACSTDCAPPRASPTSAGLSASTIISAQAFQRSTFAGFDTTTPRSSRHATRPRRRARSGGRGSTPPPPRSSRAPATTSCSCSTVCHDLGDPVGAARRVRESLAPDGALVLLEPRALEDNLNPVGRTFYGPSTVICTPNSLSQEVGRGLRAQAGEVQLRAVLSEAGFTTVRLATETPFNLILEARP